MLLCLLIVIALSFFFGFLVFITNRGWEKQTNRRFFVFTIAAVIWQITNLIMFFNAKLPNDLFWTRTTYFTGIFGAYFLFRFISTFPKRHLESKSLNIAIESIALIGTLTAAISSMMSQTITSVSYAGNSRSPEFGSMANIFNLTLMALVAFILSFCIYNFKKSNLEEKSQIKYMLLGVASTVLIIIFTDVISPIFTGSNFLSNFDSFSLVFLFGFTAYSIVKYQLFDIRVILTETAAFIVAFAVFVEIFLSDNRTQAIANSIIFILVLIGGYLLVKSVNLEIQRRKELQKLSLQLKEANTKLKQVDAMKTEFISLASHELLTPISAIEGYLSMMLDEKIVKIDNEKAVEYMSRVYTSAKRLARLVADLLNVSRIEQGRMLVDKKEIDLHALIDEVVKELKFKAQEKKHKLLTTVRPNIDTRTYGDVDKVKEIIINLTGNSIKYTKDGGLIGIGIDLWPTRKVESNFNKMQSELKEHGKTSEGSLQNIVNDKFAELIGDKQLVVIIKDTGIGISHDDLGRLFQKFSRVGDWSTQEVQGTGLGLYISRALVEMHHGRIWAYSEGEGKGSTFYFSLPTVEAENQIKQLDAEVPVAKDAKPMAKSAARL